MNQSVRNSVLIGIVAFLYSSSVLAQGVTIPAGTWIYGEIDQSVTSGKKTATGAIVRAHAWRNVVVEGQIVVKAGAPMIVRVSKVKRAKIAGRKGVLELEAVSVRAADGSEVLLDGGYDKSGRGRQVLSISLFALVAWPLIFLKGKQAVLETGTVFDCAVQADTTLDLERSARPVIRLGEEEGLAADILYDEMELGEKQETLPLNLRLCGQTLESAAVVTVNGQGISQIPVEIDAKSDEGDCDTAHASLDLKRLSKHFRKGINRFEIEAAGKRVEIVLDVEL